MNKLTIGVISAAVFFLFNTFIMGIIGNFLFVGGDPFTKSFHMFTYTGLMTLCGVIVVCTYIIIEKLNEVKKILNESNEKKTDV